MTSKEIDHAVRSQLAHLDGHGSIYDLDEAKLRELNPDLILTQELCDVCAVSYKTVQQARGCSKRMYAWFRWSQTRSPKFSRTFAWSVDLPIEWTGPIN